MLKAIKDKVLIEPRKEATVSEGGVHLVSSSSLEPIGWGEVKSVGFDVSHVKVGDTVVYGKYNSVAIKPELVMVKEADILCVEREDEAQS